LFDIQSEAAKEVSEKQKKDLDVLKGLDLSQFSIRGSEEDWGQALSSGKPAGLVSVKRSVIFISTYAMCLCDWTECNGVKTLTFQTLFLKETILFIYHLLTNYHRHIHNNCINNIKQI